MLAIIAEKQLKNDNENPASKQILYLNGEKRYFTGKMLKLSKFRAIPLYIQYG